MCADLKSILSRQPGPEVRTDSRAYVQLNTDCIGSYCLAAVCCLLYAVSMRSQEDGQLCSCLYTLKLIPSLVFIDVYLLPTLPSLYFRFTLHSSSASFLHIIFSHLRNFLFS